MLFAERTRFLVMASMIPPTKSPSVQTVCLASSARFCGHPAVQRGASVGVLHLLWRSTSFVNVFGDVTRVFGRFPQHRQQEEQTSSRRCRCQHSREEGTGERQRKSKGCLTVRTPTVRPFPLITAPSERAALTRPAARLFSQPAQLCTPRSSRIPKTVCGVCHNVT